jgi:hypothetical protein
MGARVVLQQPRTHTLVMKPVLAREDRHLFTDIDLVHADTALGLVLCSQHVHIHLLARQIVNVGLRGWWWRIGASSLLHETRDNAIQSLLWVDEVAHLTARTDHAERIEELEERVPRVQVSMLISVVIMVASEACFRAAVLMMLCL